MATSLTKEQRLAHLRASVIDAAIDLSMALDELSDQGIWPDNEVFQELGIDRELDRLQQDVARLHDAQVN